MKPGKHNLRSAKESPKTRKAISVFLVDDNKSYLTMLAHYLHKHFKSKIQIDSFINGEDCLKEIEKKPTIEIVILDYYLNAKSKNAMNGLQVLKKIKKVNSEIIVIMLSAEDKMKIATDCMTFGAYEYVVKSETALIRTQNIIKNLIHNVRLQSYYPQDIGGES
jgi:DNA-binding NtrC family response regulator